MESTGSPVVRCGDMVYVSGLPPFDVATGQIAKASIETQTDIVLRQMQLCLEAAGSDLDHIVKCNVYCTSVEAFAAINAVYARYFPRDHPARIFICVPSWPGAFDIEIDCVAVVSGIRTNPAVIAAYLGSHTVSTEPPHAAY
jgi:2-iminobutanoate/2-iminopropanoate deaminase